MLNNKIKISYALIFTCVLLFGLSGCRTSRNVIETTGSKEIFNGNLSSRLEMTIPVNNSVYTINGNLKLAKGKLIRISFLMPVLGTEVGRLEATENGLLIVDRVKKRFSRISWKGIHRMSGTRMDFKIIEQLINNKISLKKDEVVLKGEQIGLPAEKHLQLRLYHFSEESFEIKPTELSGKYKEVNPEVLLEFLKSL